MADPGRGPIGQTAFPGIVFSGRVPLRSELQEYCEKHGLCPICGKVPVGGGHAGRLFGRGRAGMPVVENGQLAVYNGYPHNIACTCYSLALEQAKRQLVERKDEEDVKQYDEDVKQYKRSKKHRSDDVSRTSSATMWTQSTTTTTQPTGTSAGLSDAQSSASAGPTGAGVSDAGTSHAHTEFNFIKTPHDDTKYKNIKTPHDHDVICGRGGLSNKHAGNKNWRRLVADNKELYCALHKSHKNSLVKSIVLTIRTQEPPGKFLKRDEDTQLWYDIGDGKAQEKTSQALRDSSEFRYPPSPESEETECADDPPPNLSPSMPRLGEEGPPPESSGRSAAYGKTNPESTGQERMRASAPTLSKSKPPPLGVQVSPPQTRGGNVGYATGPAPVYAAAGHGAPSYTMKQPPTSVPVGMLESHVEMDDSSADRRRLGLLPTLHRRPSETEKPPSLKAVRGAESSAARALLLLNNS